MMNPKIVLKKYDEKKSPKIISTVTNVSFSTRTKKANTRYDKKEWLLE